MKKRKKEDPSTSERKKLFKAIQENLIARPGTQAEKASVVGVSQPRLNDLLRNRVDKFSFEALIEIAVQLGLRVNLHLQELSIGGSEFSKLSVIANQLDRRSIYSIEPNTLRQLDDKQGTLLTQRLLRCEAIALGLGAKDVVLSLDLNKKDGGIDAKVEAVPPRSGSILNSGQSHFQIKTGSSFKPWQRSQLIKELFGLSRKPTKKNLGEAVRYCMDHDGTYILYTFGHDLLPVEHSKAQSILKDLFNDCGYRNPKISVLGCGQIAGELARFPSLCLELKGLAEKGFQSFAGWKNQSMMRLPFFVSKAQESLISEIRETLLNGTAQHIRLTGEPGIGKTRLILEAVSNEFIAPSIVYIPTGQDFQNSKLVNEIMKLDNELSVVLVIDDCDSKDRASIWSLLKDRPGIKLITVDHELDRSNDTSMKCWDCPRLDDDQIVDILSSYLPNAGDLRNWAKWCDGSPRVAHAVGENLAVNPDDVLRSPAEVNIWDRYVLGHKELASAEAEQHRLVLRYIALFQRFGFEQPVESEAKFISRMIQEIDPLITWGKFQTIVQHHRNRRVLQGRHTLFLVPKALHVHLWIEYWQCYGIGFRFQEVLTEMPSGMRDWFLRLFIYAGSTPAASFVVGEVLSDEGPYSDPEFLKSDTGARLLSYLAEADPAKTLNLIERLFGEWDQERLLTWHTGRQDVVFALEKIAVHDNCFRRAVTVLIQFALAENARNSNNSKGVLLDLFQTGIGWAATQASPSKRLPIIKDLVKSTDANKRSLGFEMCEKWLNTYGGYRTIGPEHQGLNPTIEFWRPDTYGELWDFWRELWEFLEDELNGFNDQDVNRVTKIFISAAKSRLQNRVLASYVMGTVSALAKNKRIDKKPLVEFVIHMFKFRKKELESDVVSFLDQLDSELTGTSLWDRTERFVLNTNWDEDYELHDDEIHDLDEPMIKVRNLASEYIENLELFIELLPNLLTESGHKLPELGEECGKLTDISFDTTVSNLTLRIDVNREFLGGYLAGIRKQSEERWGSFIVRLLHRDKTRNLAVDCLWRSGVSETVLVEMCELYDNGLLGSKAFNRLAYLDNDEKISEDLLLRILSALLRKPDEYATRVGIDLIYGFYIHRKSKRKLPEDPIFSILISFSDEAEENSAHEWYHWSKIAEVFLKQFAKRKIDFLEKLLIKGDLSRYGDAKDKAEIADSIVKELPEQSWGVIAHHLDSKSGYPFSLTNWLGDVYGFSDRGNSELMNHLPNEQILAWTKKKPSERQRILLAILPTTLDLESGGLLTKMSIDEFADDRNFLDSLLSHFYTGGWRGPRSEHLERKRDQARRWLSTENSVACNSWIERFIDSLDESIFQARIDEEREF